MSGECDRCGEEIAEGECPDCGGKEFCGYCDLEEAAFECDGCSRFVCNECVYVRSPGTPDEHSSCEGCAEDYEIAMEQRADAEREDYD